MWRRPQNSLRFSLIDRLLPSMLVLFLLGAIAAYWVALGSATRAYDRGLLDTAFAFGEQLQMIKGEPRLVLEPQARAVLQTDKFDVIFLAVRGPRGELFDGEARLPLPVKSTWLGGPEDRRTYYDGMLGDEPVRIAALKKKVGKDTFTILAAETLVKRNEMVQSLLLGMLPTQLLLMLLACGLIWFGIRGGLSPLETLRGELAQRAPTDLQPITLSVPEEVQPLAREINALLARLDVVLESQRNFVSDAAHQLRTPIAALQAQVEVASQEAGAGLPTDLSGIQGATQRLSHLVTQLLALARAEPRPEQANAPVDIGALVQRVADTWLPRAIARDIDLGFELEPVSIPANALLIEEMLGNLLDNALRHTPAHGTVTVSCGRDRTHVWLQVEDNGPGIPPEDRERVFARFYRPAGPASDGCGLGLAIVRQIARQHGGRVSASRSERWGGARLRVVFPLPRRAALQQTL